MKEWVSLEAWFLILSRSNLYRYAHHAIITCIITLQEQSVQVCTSSCNHYMYHYTAGAICTGMHLIMQSLHVSLHCRSNLYRYAPHHAIITCIITLQEQSVQVCTSSCNHYMYHYTAGAICTGMHIIMQSLHVSLHCRSNLYRYAHHHAIITCIITLHRTAVLHDIITSCYQYHEIEIFFQSLSLLLNLLLNLKVYESYVPHNERVIQFHVV